MAKTYTQYVCQQCGRRAPKAMGRCPKCGEWDSMVEEVVEKTPAAKTKVHRQVGVPSMPHRLTDISSDAEDRMPLPIEEFSRVLGGGIVIGSVVLIGGDPGIGKSTLLLQTTLAMARTETVLYVSGEESERQIKMRAMRVMTGGDGAELPLPKTLYLVTETSLDVILEHIETTQPSLVVIDSIQTTYLSQLESSAGSISQVRETASRLRELAKNTGITIFLIGHVTKDGALAGPRTLEHIVDAVLYLEGDRFQTYRLLRTVKNRYGATSEVGVFEMRERGLIEVRNPSEAFLAERMINAPGSSIAVTMEGTRPLLVEIQGLTSPTSFGNPRRTPNGIDYNRLLLIVAVLSRRVNIRLSEQDVFVNVIGGLKINEPAADLAVAAAIASSVRDIPLRADTVLIGEIGLSGELRMVGQMAARLYEASKLGFKTAIVPKRLRKGEPWPEGIKIIEVRSLREGLKQALVDN
jgi:DNA repair protein RadA/Sms